MPALTDWGWGRKLDAERESLGLYLSGHPCDQYRGDLPFVCTATVASLLGERPPPPGEYRGGGREVLVAGIVAGIRKRGAVSGTPGCKRPVFLGNRRTSRAVPLTVGCETAIARRLSRFREVPYVQSVR